MKKLLSILLVFCLVAPMLFVSAYAETAEKTYTDRYGEWTYTEVDRGASITRYKGEAKEVVVPDYVDGLLVVKIGKGAFKDCSFIERLYLPYALEEIEDGFVEGCPDITVYAYEGTYAAEYLLAHKDEFAVNLIVPGPALPSATISFGLKKNGSSRYSVTVTDLDPSRATEAELVKDSASGLWCWPEGVIKLQVNSLTRNDGTDLSASYPYAAVYVKYADDTAKTDPSYILRLTDRACKPSESASKEITLTLGTDFSVKDSHVLENSEKAAASGMTVITEADMSFNAAGAPDLSKPFSIAKEASFGNNSSGSEQIWYVPDYDLYCLAMSVEASENYSHLNAAYNNGKGHLEFIQTLTDSHELVYSFDEAGKVSDYWEWTTSEENGTEYVEFSDVVVNGTNMYGDNCDKSAIYTYNERSATDGTLYEYVNVSYTDFADGSSKKDQEVFEFQTSASGSSSADHMGWHWTWNYEDGANGKYVSQYVASMNTTENNVAVNKISTATLNAGAGAVYDFKYTNPADLDALLQNYTISYSEMRDGSSVAFVTASLSDSGQVVYEGTNDANEIARVTNEYSAIFNGSTTITAGGEVISQSEIKNELLGVEEDMFRALDTTAQEAAADCLEVFNEGAAETSNSGALLNEVNVLPDMPFDLAGTAA